MFSRCFPLANRRYKINTKRYNHEIKPKDKVLLSIKNLTNKKLDRPYIGAFKVKKVLGVVIILKLLDIGIFLKFYIRFLKKVLLGVSLVKH